MHSLETASRTDSWVGVNAESSMIFRGAVWANHRFWKRTASLGQRLSELDIMVVVVGYAMRARFKVMVCRGY